MDDKLLRLARKINKIENELSKITQIKDLEGLLFVNTEITNKYRKSINDVVDTYKDYISKTQKELTESMSLLKKENKEKTIKDKKLINDLDNKTNKIKEDIKSICVGIDKSIEEIQKGMLKEIKIKNNEILENLKIKDKEISQVKKENEVLNNCLNNLKDMLNKLELQKGDNGKSAYEIACELGFKGSVEEWIKSLHGKDGKDIELRGMRSFSDAPNDNKSYVRKNKKWVEINKSDNGHVYGIKRKITNNSSPSWERILDSVGEFANATKNGETVQNTFDNLEPWSSIKSCNYDLTTKEINAWFGDPNFKFDGTNGDVFTYIPKTYWRIYQEDDYDYILLADYPKAGFMEVDGFFVGRYNCTDVGGKLHTYSGLVPTTNRTVTTFRNSANSLGNKFSQLDWRYFVIQMLYLVEYATYDSQIAVGNGIMSRNLVNTLIAENSTNRVVVPSNTNFYIGQIIRIGTSANGGQIGLDRKITAVEEYDDGTITGYSVTFAGAPVNIAVGNYVTTCAQQTGQCDILGMKSGCLNNDGYHSVIYRGMENIYGDVFQFVDGINIRDSQVYICKDHSQYQTDLFELPYKPLSYINYPTSNGWAKKLGFDINEPFFRFPTEVGGSSSAHLCDYYVKGTGSVNFRIGGCSTDGQKNGFWSFYTSGSTAGASWDRACRILIDS